MTTLDNIEWYFLSPLSARGAFKRSPRKMLSGDTSENVSTDKIMVENVDQQHIKTFKRRWFMMLIFMLYEAINTWQWIMFSIVTDVIVKYYKVSTYAVDWTAIIFLLVYVPAILPASIFMDKKASILFY